MEDSSILVKLVVSQKDNFQQPPLENDCIHPISVHRQSACRTGPWPYWKKVSETPDLTAPSNPASSRPSSLLNINQRPVRWAAGALLTEQATGSRIRKPLNSYRIEMESQKRQKPTEQPRMSSHTRKRWLGELVCMCVKDLPKSRQLVPNFFWNTVPHSYPCNFLRASTCTLFFSYIILMKIETNHNIRGTSIILHDSIQKLLKCGEIPLSSRMKSRDEPVHALFPGAGKHFNIPMYIYILDLLVSSDATGLRRFQRQLSSDCEGSLIVCEYPYLS